MSGKNKNTETDIEKLDRYESLLGEDELKKLQTLKSVLLFIGIALIVIVMFLPSDTSFHGTHTGFVTTFAFINVIAMAFALDLLFQDNRRYKIRKTVLKKQAPKYGFDKKLTYLIYEIFCVLNLVLVAEQCAIVAFARDGFAIAGLCLIIIAAGCVIASRFILVKANCGQMRLIEVEEKEKNEEESAPEDPAAEKNETAEETESAADDDFYSPPKEQ